MYLVTGATGHVGSELVTVLTAAGHQVRALVRRGRRMPLPDGAAAVGGDLNEPESLAAALDGVYGVFLLPGYRDMPGVYAQVRAAQAVRVVQLSGTSAVSGDDTNAVTRYMAATERAARASGLDVTILRPSGFMSNTLEWADQLRDGDTVVAPWPDVRIAAVDPNDIAAVAAVALTEDGHAGEDYWPTGPQALAPADRVRILGEVLGRTLHYEAEPDDVAYARMSAAMPAEYVDAFFDFYSAGALDESPVRTTVSDLLGRPPRTFRQWVAAHASEFGRS